MSWVNGERIDDFAEAMSESKNKPKAPINVELLRESLRIMRWDPETIEFIVGAVAREIKNVRG